MASRREFLGTAGAAALLASVGVRAQAAEAPRPNILIVVCDQLSIDALSAYRRHFEHPAYACHWLETPHLDDLVQNGVSFLESHAANPVCSPSRSCLFTGRMSVETGLIQNNIGIDRDVPNLGQWFESHGDYRRVYCGKWHAGGQWNVPTVDGPRRIPGFETLPNGPGGWGQEMDPGISGGVAGFVHNYRDERPFLAVASFMDPHDICFWTPGQLGRGRIRETDFFGLGDQLPLPPPNQDYDFPEIWPGSIPAKTFGEMAWRNYLYDYCRMVERLDHHVGRLVQAVRARDDDTLLVFTSDHGDGLGRHRRVQKWHPYEHSVKVPLVVYGPKLGVRQGVIDETHLVSGVDLAATVCDYAGLPSPPHARGASLRPLLEGRETSWRDNVYFELRLAGRGIRTARYKYITSYQLSPPKQRPTAEAVFLTKAGKPAEFVQGEGSRFQRHPVRMLFDLEADPWETRNLAAEPQLAGVLEEHERILRDEWEAKLIPGHHFTRG